MVGCKCPAGVHGQWTGTVDKRGWLMSCRSCLYEWTVEESSAFPRAAELAALRAEVARLRDALAAIMPFVPLAFASTGRPDGASDRNAELERARELARAALKEPGHE